MDILPEIVRRSSIHRFSDEDVAPEAVARIIEAARLAPSAKNRQAWRFLVIRDPERRQALQRAGYGQEWIGQAPVIVASCTTNVDYTMPNGQLSYPIDLTIATSFMMLQAVREGLGTCLITTFDEDDAKAVLSIPHRMRVVTLLLVGKAAEEAGPPNRLPTDRIVSYEHW